MNESEEKRLALAASTLSHSDNHTQFGMRFLLDTGRRSKDLGLSRELVTEFFTALASIHYQE